MKVIESFVQGKRPDQTLCEDRIVVTDDFAAVVDGATDKTGFEYDGVAGGVAASEILSETVAGLRPDCNAYEAVDKLTRVLNEKVRGGPPDAPSAAIIIFSRRSREIWQVGDVSYSPIDVRLRRPTRKRIDTDAAGVRAAYTQTLLAEGADPNWIRSSDPGRDVIAPLLKNQYLLRNSHGPFSYGAVDGTPVPRELIHIERLSPGLEQLIIYSDGYPKPGRTLEIAESNLARLLERDPLCIHELLGTKSWHPGNSSFDDRAYLRLDLRDEW